MSNRDWLLLAIGWILGATATGIYNIFKPLPRPNWRTLLIIRKLPSTAKRHVIHLDGDHPDDGPKLWPKQPGGRTVGTITDKEIFDWALRQPFELNTRQVWDLAVTEFPQLELDGNGRKIESVRIDQARKAFMNKLRRLRAAHTN